MSKLDGMSSHAPGTRRTELPSSDQLNLARQAVAAVVPRSPMITVGDHWHLKLDSLLPTGSFKTRGATAAVHADPSPASTLVTASTGNHAAALAHRAQASGRTCIVFVPANVSPRKLSRLRTLGALIRIHEGDFDETERAAIGYAATHTDARFVSPYNDPWVIAGQATTGFEILEQLDGPLTIAVPAGGGGLLTGCALAARTTTREIKLVAVEAARSATLSAHRNGTEAAERPTIADAVAGGIEQGSLVFEILDEIDQLVSVTETEIRDAIRWLALEHGLVAEGAGALAVAAVMNGAVNSSHPIVSLVSGSNIANDTLISVLTEATGQ